jgi:hypothetical protein
VIRACTFGEPVNLIGRAVFLGLILLCWADTNKECVAQETFNINSSSALYDVKVTIDKCDPEEKRLDPGNCTGPGRVSIYKKGSTSPFQILKLKNIEINKEQIAYNSKVNKDSRALYDDEYSLIFGDFNFDASEDVAVCNGRNGGYAAPSYNVYLYNKHSQRFAENVRFSRLTEGYLGLFFVDAKKRQLTAYSKSGCCYHETDVFKVVNNRPVLVEKVIEEASGSDTDGYVVRVTTRKLVGGRWVKRVSKRKEKAGEP